MNILITKQLNEDEQKQIWKLLTESDKEFVPPLSSRNSTQQSSFDTSASEGTVPKEYFDNLLKQQFILAKDAETVVGFLSFLPEKDLAALTGLTLPPVNYVSTIIVNKSFRGHGITRQMYHCLIENAGGFPIATRTWSTNFGHLHILQEEGFKLIHTITDDRGPGIDTVYYMRPADCATDSSTD